MTHLLVSMEAAIQGLADDAISRVSPNIVQKCAMPTFDLLYPTEGVDPSFVPEPLGDINMDDCALVLHSSGPYFNFLSGGLMLIGFKARRRSPNPSSSHRSRCSLTHSFRVSNFNGHEIILTEHLIFKL